jgi:hypothetical protein
MHRRTLALKQSISAMDGTLKPGQRYPALRAGTTNLLHPVYGGLGGSQPDQDSYAAIGHTPHLTLNMYNLSPCSIDLLFMFRLVENGKAMVACCGLCNLNIYPVRC